MIELNNIAKNYHSKAGTVSALQGVDLKFDDSGMVFIFGRSGSGKSTLLHLIGALDTPDSGELIIDGQCTTNYSQSDYDAFRNQKVGFIFQEYNLLDELNVSENIALALELQGLEKNTENIESVLANVDLSGYGERKVSTLSGGQKQRVAIARALVKNPSIILADEPTGALDSESGGELYTLLKKLSKKLLVIVVSHDEHAVAEYADRIIGLKDGKISVDSDKTTTEKSDNYALPNKDDKAKKMISMHTSEVKQNDFHAKAIVDSTANEISKKVRHKQKNKGLTFKSTFKVGLRVFFSKPVRLIISIILSATAFFALGMSINVASYDKVETAARSLNGTTDYLAYKKETYNAENDWWDESNMVLGKTDWRSTNVSLTDDDISNMEEQYGKDFVGVVPFGNFGNTNVYHEMNGLPYLSSSRFGLAEYPGINGAVYLDEDIQNTTGFKVYGHLPVSEDEIAITDYMYQLYKKLGYNTRGCYYNDIFYEPFTKDINIREDLFGQKLEITFIDEYSPRYLTICGIIDTGFNYDKYKILNEKTDYSEMSLEESRLREEFVFEMNSSWHALVFLSETLISQTPAQYSYALTSFPDNQKELNKAAKLCFNEQNGVRYTFYNYITNQIFFADAALTIGKEVALYVGLALGAFAVLLLANYVSATVSEKKRTVGIIRALGGGGNQVLKIFLIQSVLVALCVFATTLIFSFIGAEVIGILMKKFLNLTVKLIYVDIAQAGILLGLSVAVAVIAASIPVCLMVKKKPIDVIRF
ncbi:MAG: ABC transporter ATP-binding protein/permease [Paludibacteraceae bacterium]|nr:ABC transporter ATP-binding protein/permease [Paludibacteraceae bacterium]